MTLLSVQNLKFAYGSSDLYKDTSFTVSHGERVGLIGGNGSGKSTLLKIISGELTSDSGKVVFRKGLRIGLVPQFIPTNILSQTIKEMVLDELNVSRPGSNILPYEVQMQLEMAGFNSSEFDTKVINLSGGWLNRLLLVRALCSHPDIFLLDEPSNHMDTESIRFLEEFLQSLPNQAFVIISHDRELLDRCTERTLILRDKNIYDFNSSYSSARKKLLELDEAAEHLRSSQWKEADRLRASSKQLAHWAHVYGSKKLSSRAKNIERRATRIEQSIESKPFEIRRKVELSDSIEEARLILRINELDLKYKISGPSLAKISQMWLKRGDRVALVGPNGCGKSTLLRTIAVSTGEDASVRIHPKVSVGYYEQTLMQFESDFSLLKYLENNCPQERTKLLGALAKAGFGPATWERKVKALSGGEKSRLAFLIFRLNKPDLLILDEPTNHMDVFGIEQLENELLKRDVSVLFVSHDRRFIANVGTRVFVFNNKKVIENY
ncbi:MAG: ABC-F family ATP-binding cassette domain-containing protein [Deltaproteobacteria bacterium]|nr:ABC-F family ATP-binding cassette domain-containing protein [Deltaproteobacteria bacterium]